jgi:UDP-N-acetylmuramate dehydrogenase
MNAGGHGSDMSASLSQAFVVDLAGDGSSRLWQNSEFEFAYRSSVLTDNHVVVWADLQLAEGKVEDAEAEVAEIVRWRRANQPGGQNCGSVFTNPTNDAAGRLVDLAGCKGLRVGTASVSPKHANFIQADPEGSAADVAAVITTVRKRVRAEFGVDLHPEVRFVGFDGTALEVTQ